MPISAKSMTLGRRGKNFRFTDRFVGVLWGDLAKPEPASLSECGAPGEIRTHDLLLRRQTLYPAELRARVPLFYRTRAMFGLMLRSSR